jgi:hypothetical protein
MCLDQIVGFDVEKCVLSMVGVDYNRGLKKT